MRDFASGLGAEFIFDAQINPRLDGAENLREELQLPAPDVLALDRAEPGRLQELRDFCGRFVGPRDAGEAAQLYSCGAGETSFVIDPYGQLRLCVLARRTGYDLRQGSFARGWREVLPRLRAQTWQSRSACRTCSLVSLCGSCPAAAELEHGDPEAPVETFCRIAHLRASAAAADTGGHTADASCCLYDHRCAGLSA
jgi:radical SAM protein with 4Fe4S-binding SPASM domain